MHQVRFRLRLRPRPRWGSLQRSPRLLARFKGRTSKGRTGRKGKGDGNGKGGENHTGNFPLHFETRTSQNMRHIHLLATWPQKRRYEYTACTPLRGSKPPSTFTTDIQKQNCIFFNTVVQYNFRITQYTIQLLQISNIQNASEI